MCFAGCGFPVARNQRPFVPCDDRISPVTANHESNRRNENPFRFVLVFIFRQWWREGWLLFVVSLIILGGVTWLASGVELRLGRGVRE